VYCTILLELVNCPYLTPNDWGLAKILLHEIILLNSHGAKTISYFKNGINQNVELLEFEIYLQNFIKLMFLIRSFLD